VRRVSTIDVINISKDNIISSVAISGDYQSYLELGNGSLTVNSGRSLWAFGPEFSEETKEDFFIRAMDTAKFFARDLPTGLTINFPMFSKSFANDPPSVAALGLEFKQQQRQTRFEGSDGIFGLTSATIHSSGLIWLAADQNGALHQARNNSVGAALPKEINILSYPSLRTEIVRGRSIIHSQGLLATGSLFGYHKIIATPPNALLAHSISPEIELLYFDPSKIYNLRGGNEVFLRYLNAEVNIWTEAGWFLSWVSRDPVSNSTALLFRNADIENDTALVFFQGDKSIKFQCNSLKSERSVRHFSQVEAAYSERFRFVTPIGHINVKVPNQPKLAVRYSVIGTSKWPITIWRVSKPGPRRGLWIINRGGPVVNWLETDQLLTDRERAAIDLGWELAFVEVSGAGSSSTKISSRLQVYGMNAFTKDAKIILKSLVIPAKPESLIVEGTSFGAGLAAEIVRLSPRKVDLLVALMPVLENHSLSYSANALAESPELRLNSQLVSLMNKNVLKRAAEDLAPQQNSRFKVSAYRNICRFPNRLIFFSSDDYASRLSDWVHQCPETKDFQIFDTPVPGVGHLLPSNSDHVILERVAALVNDKNTQPPP
jgi:pimeloyl-ACP methyl ester carboxylesterase